MVDGGSLVSSGPMLLDPLYVVLELGAATFFVWAAIAALTIAPTAPPNSRSCHSAGVAFAPIASLT